jgi:hypothetical protein
MGADQLNGVALGAGIFTSPACFASCHIGDEQLYLLAERYSGRGDAQPLGWVYAANTACHGRPRACGVLLFPNGTLSTNLVFAGVNGACALLAWRTWGQDLLSPVSSSTGQKALSP